MPGDRQREYTVEAHIGPLNDLVARVTRIDRGILATESTQWRIETPIKDKIDNITSGFAKFLKEPTVSDYDFGYGGDTAWQSYTITAADYLSTTGELTFLKLNPIQEDRKNLLKKKAMRHYPVYFGKPRRTITRVTWTLPEGLRMKADGDSTTLEDNLGSIATELSSESNVITFTSDITYSGKQTSPEEYQSARKFERSRNKAWGAVAFVEVE